MNRAYIASLFAILCTAVTSTQAHAAPATTVFPVVVGAPIDAVPVNVKGTGAIFRQAVRPLAGVRISTPVSIALGRKTIAIAAGTLFIAAFDLEGPLYCLATSEKPDGWFTNFDLGICLRDKDRDLKADQILVSDVKNSRARTPFEIRRSTRDDAFPISVNLEPVEPKRLPSGEIRLDYFDNSKLSDASRAYLMLRFCAPAELTTAAVKSPPLCGQVQWPQDVRIDGNAGGSPLRGNVMEPVRVDWGKVSVTMTKQPDGSFAVHLDSAFPQGTAAVVQSGAWGNANDYHSQISVFAVLGLDQKTLEKMGLQP